MSSGFTATIEQEQVCASQARALVVNAPSGSGKTSVQVEYARRRPGMRFIYLAYNRSIRDEAARKFPSNVRCLTTHGLAFPMYGKVYQAKLGNPKPFHVSRSLSVGMTQAGRALDVVNAFLASPDADIGMFHALRAEVPEDKMGEAVSTARRVWSLMQDARYADLPMPHDGYLKLFQLSQPVIQTDCILFDEAQDANPVTVDVVSRQICRKVVVGDRYQSIYGFRGAINGMDMFDADETLALTASFRFGTGIAQLASALLRDWQGETIPLRGLGRHATCWQVDESQPHTILARTNAGLFDAAVGVLNKNAPFGFAGGVDSYKFDLILDAYRLQAGQRMEIRDRMLQSFRSWSEFKDYANEIDDRESKVLIRVVDEYGSHIPGLIDRIKSEAHSPLTGDEVVLSTAHKAKGLEWNSVVLIDDFTELATQRDPDTGEEAGPDPQEINLIYVACTRAIANLKVNANILTWLKEAGHHVLWEPILAAMRQEGQGAPEQASPASSPQAVTKVARLAAKLRTGESLSQAEALTVARILESLHA